MKRLVVGLLLMLAARAHAQDEPVPDPEPEKSDPSLRTFVGGALNRARRAIAFGPSVGVGAAYFFSAEELDYPLTFGLGADLFKVPVVPTPAMIQGLIKERVKAKVLQRAKQMVTEGRPPPDQAELARMAREVYEEVKAEVLGEMNVRAKMLEKPRLVGLIEGTYLPRAEAWQVRVGVGLGVSIISVGPTLTYNLGDSDGLFAGGEAAVRLLPSKSPRSPVVDLFLRAEFGVTDEVSEADHMVLGARFLLDVI